MGNAWTDCRTDDGDHAGRHERRSRRYPTRHRRGESFVHGRGVCLTKVRRDHKLPPGPHQRHYFAPAVARCKDPGATSWPDQIPDCSSAPDPRRSVPPLVRDCPASRYFPSGARHCYRAIPASDRSGHPLPDGSETRPDPSHHDPITARLRRVAAEDDRRVRGIAARPR